MSSPVVSHINQVILLDKSLQTPIYLQIAQQIIIAIQRGIIPIGSKLPGTRILAQDLQVHRKTIIAGIHELEAQGWVEAKPNIGTFVIMPEFSFSKKDKPKALRLVTNYPSETGFEVKKSTLLDLPIEKPERNDIVVTDGTPDLRLIHIKSLTQSYSAALKRKPVTYKLLDAQQENQFFKNQLTNYLNLTRGLHLLPQNILPTRSAEMSLHLISQVLLSKNDLVVVAAIGNYKANMIFQQVGAKLIPLEVDAQGLKIEKLESFLKGNTIRAIYITPQNHYPTTVTLSASRRMLLLELAKKFGFIIIEDDYDYEFNYEKAAMLPLASADTDGVVVYLGTFGKALLPNFRTSFVVAPQNLIIQAKKHLQLIDTQSDVVLQQALADMINEGDMPRYMKKALKEYKSRRDFMINVIETNLNEYLTAAVPTGGLALWLQFKVSVNLTELQEQLKQSQVHISRINLYQNQKYTAMRVGFANLTLEELHLFGTKLQQILLNLIIKSKA